MLLPDRLDRPSQAPEAACWLADRAAFSSGWGHNHVGGRRNLSPCLSIMLREQHRGWCAKPAAVPPEQPRGLYEWLSDQPFALHQEDAFLPVCPALIRKAGRQVSSLSLPSSRGPPDLTTMTSVGANTTTRGTFANVV